jgi:hypothetical protein
MDSTALLTAIFGALGAVVAYWVVKRRWWKAVGSIAIGGASLLNIGPKTIARTRSTVWYSTRR